MFPRPNQRIQHIVGAESVSRVGVSECEPHSVAADRKKTRYQSFLRWCIRAAEGRRLLWSRSRRLGDLSPISRWRYRNRRTNPRASASVFGYRTNSPLLSLLEKKRKPWATRYSTFFHWVTSLREGGLNFRDRATAFPPQSGSVASSNTYGRMTSFDALQFGCLKRAIEPLHTFRRDGLLHSPGTPLKTSSTNSAWSSVVPGTCSRQSRRCASAQRECVGLRFPSREAFAPNVVRLFQ
jgi:hypothetical protein